MRTHILSRMASASALALLALLSPGSTTVGARPDLYCGKGSPRWDVAEMPIPVYFNEELADVVCDNSTCDMEALRWSTAVTLDEFYDSAGSELSFYYAGTHRNSDFVDGAILVRPQENCNSGVGTGAGRDPDGDGKTDYGEVTMCASFRTRPVTWNSFPSSSSNTSLSWQGVMAQEVGHAIGFRHPPECNQNFKSIMGTFTSSSNDGHHLYKDDIDAYQSEYQFREKDVNVIRSNNGLNWTEEAPPGGLELALSRYSACTTTASLASFVSYPSDQIPRLINVWRLDASGWTQLASPLFAASNYHTGTACKDFNNVAVAWSSGYSDTSGMQEVFLSTSSDGGDTWTLETVSQTNTRNAGVSAAYDPESDAYIVMWRNNRDEVTSKVVAPGANVNSYQTDPASSSFLRASDSVSIACGSADVVGPENCIVAWADTGWSRTLRWAHAHVESSSGSPMLVLGPIRSHPYIIFGTPSVAYWSDGDFPWMLVFHQGGNTAYVVWKEADINATWQNERSFSAGEKIVNPVIATRSSEADDVSGRARNAVYLLFTSTPSP